MKKKNYKEIISILFCTLLGSILGLVVSKHMFIENNGNKLALSVVLELLILFSCIFIQIIIHEAGHLLFGLISGYKFVSFRIFSFMWINEKDKIKFKRLSIDGTAGQCLMSPPNLVNRKFPVILYNLGGSILNVIASIIAFIVYFKIGYTTFLSMFAFIGLVFAIMNGVPMCIGMVNNDGYNVISLTRNNMAIYSLWVQLKANEQMSRGIRLKDMPDEWFVVPKEEEMKNSIVSAIGVFSCNRLMDKHKFEEANNLMKHLLEINSGMVRIHRNLIICDRIYCELMTGNIEKAHKLFNKDQKKFMKSMKKFPSILRTEYSYVLIAEKDIEKAENIKNDFEKYTARYPYPSHLESEKELIDIAYEYFKSNLRN